MKNNKTPLKLNERLIRNARHTSNYSGGDMSTRGKWDVDAMFNPAKEVMASRMLKKENEKKNKKEIENPTNNTNNTKPFENKPNNKVDAPTQYEMIDCSDIVGEPGYHANCGAWVSGKVSVETEAYKNWKANQSPLDMASPTKHPIPDKTLKDRSKITHRHDEKGKSHWVGKDGKDVPKNILNDLAGGGINKSPFQRYSALKTKVRASYVPDVNSQASPFQQWDKGELNSGGVSKNNMLPEATVGGGDGGSIWNTFKDMSEESLSEIKLSSITNDISKNEKYGNNIKPIDKVPNKAWKETITKYLNFCKENIVNAVKDGQTGFKDVWMSNAKNLTSNVQQYLNKREDWSLNNAGDESPTNKGGSMISAASHKGDSRQWDLTYLGAPNMNLDISEEGDMYFKLADVDDIWTVNDLDRNVHNKDFRGLQIWSDLKKEIGKASKEGKDFNGQAIEGVVDGLLQTPEAVNSWAHDDLDGENLFDRYYSAAGEADLNVNSFMRESPDYNIEIITDMVKNGMLSMAKHVHDASGVKKENKGAKLSASELMKKYR